MGTSRDVRFIWSQHLPTHSIFNITWNGLFNIKGLLNSKGSAKEDVLEELTPHVEAAAGGPIASGCAARSVEPKLITVVLDFAFFAHCMEHVSFRVYVSG